MASNKTQSPLKETPPNHSESASNLKNKIDYPNYFSWQTRSGNLPWFVSDSKGNEFMMAMHRTGTHWEMTESGAFKFVASKNREDITFGKHVSYVTGAQDTTVKGDSSIKTDGSRRTTTNGNDENTVKGKSVVSAKSVNITAAEQFDVAAQSGTILGDKGFLMASTNGPAAIQTVNGGVSVVSENGTASVSSKNGSSVMNAGKEIAMKSGTGINMLGGPEVVINADGEVHVKAGNAKFVMKDGKIYLNSSEQAKTAKTPTQVNTSKKASETVKEQTASGVTEA
jgi:hypothetical protein